MRTVGLHDVDGVGGLPGGGRWLPGADKGDSFAVGGKGGVIVESKRPGQAFESAASEPDGVQIGAAVALGDESDLFAVCTEDGVVVEVAVNGEPMALACFDVGGR